MEQRRKSPARRPLASNDFDPRGDKRAHVYEKMRKYCERWRGLCATCSHFSDNDGRYGYCFRIDKERKRKESCELWKEMPPLEPVYMDDFS